MTKLCPVLIVLLVLLDCLIISLSRQLLISFSAQSRNRKSAKRIYSNQKKLQKITLSYLKPLVKNHARQFTRFYLVYVMELLTLLPQYLAVLICLFIFGGETRFALYVLCVIKGFLFVLFRTQFDRNKVSKYERIPK